MNTKLKLNNILQVIEKTFFHCLLGFAPTWDLKLNQEYIFQKIVDKMPLDKLSLCFDCIDGPILNGIGKSINSSFASDRRRALKIFCEPEAIHFKKQTKLF